MSCTRSLDRRLTSTVVDSLTESSSLRRSSRANLEAGRPTRSPLHRMSQAAKLCQAPVSPIATRMGKAARTNRPLQRLTGWTRTRNKRSRTADASTSALSSPNMTIGRPATYGIRVMAGHMNPPTVARSISRLCTSGRRRQGRTRSPAGRCVVFTVVRVRAARYIKTTRRASRRDRVITLN